MEAMTKTSEQRAKILIIEDDEPTLDVIAEYVSYVHSNMSAKD